MSRILPKPLSSYPWYLRLLFRFQKKKYGAIFEPVLLWGRSPRVFLGFLLIQKGLNRKSSMLAPDLRALITIKVSQFNQCAFCIDMNSAILLKRGGTQEKLTAISRYKESSLFSAKERAALDYVEAIMQNSHQVSDRVFQALKEHFDDDAIVELTALIGFQNLSSQFNSALDAAAFGFCQIQDIKKK